MAQRVVDLDASTLSALGAEAALLAAQESKDLGLATFGIDHPAKSAAARTAAPVDGASDDHHDRVGRRRSA